MEKKLDSLLRDFEYHAREMINVIQDRAAAQKLSKDAERRVSKLRREFREQFDSAVVAHTTGADQDDPHAQPQLVKARFGGRYGEVEVCRPPSAGSTPHR